MFKYLKDSLIRKKARRFFQEYPYAIDQFNLEKEGRVEFANWKNPLARPFKLKDAEMAFWNRFINMGDLVIDIGANIGDTTVPMALAAGKEGLTLGFDPNPHVYKVLEKNAQLNKEKTMIQTCPYAIAGEECLVTYQSSEASFANGGISRTDEGKHGRFKLKKKVKGINLHHFLEKKYKKWLSRLSLIKVDAEGDDVEIFRSLDTLIARYKPALVGEFFQKYTLEERKVLFDLIDGMGYHLFYFYDFSELRQVFRITRDNLDQPEIFNFYAVPA